jgi:hypothetical protein
MLVIRRVLRVMNRMVSGGSLAVRVVGVIGEVEHVLVRFLFVLVHVGWSRWEHGLRAVRGRWERGWVDWAGRRRERGRRVITE